MVRLCELRDKEVINVCDGERLGNVCDIDFDEKTEKICTLIIPGPCKVLGILGRDHEYIVPLSRVCRIGSDSAGSSGYGKIPQKNVNGIDNSL